MLPMHKNLEPKLEQVTQDRPLPCPLTSFSSGLFRTYLSPLKKKKQQKTTTAAFTRVGIRVGNPTKPTVTRMALLLPLPQVV